MNYQHPIYEIEIKSSACAVSLDVNSIPCFVNYEKGGMAVDWPINQNILESGIQYFKIKAFPYIRETQISRKAKIEFTVYVRDAFKNSQKRITVLNTIYVDFSKEEQDYNIYNYNGHFYAEVPYKNDGWRNGIKIFNENKDELKLELENWYKLFEEIYLTNDIDRYMEVCNERIQEIKTAFYLKDNDIELRKKTMIPNFKNGFKKVSLNQYKIFFSENLKLVGLCLPFSTPGFRFDSNDKNTMIVTESALFYRINTNEPLRLIR